MLCWVPVDELSDKQKNGAWWLFAQDRGVSFHGNCLSRFKFDDNSWWNMYNMPVSEQCILKEHYFLNEPIPPFPAGMRRKGWVSFDVELPKEDEFILIYSKSRKIEMMKSLLVLESDFRYRAKITHWRYLPDVPS